MRGTSLSDDAERLRRYLTGVLSDEEAGEVEARLLEDDELFELAEAVERDVLTDLARGRLDPAEATSVQRWLTASPQGRNRLELAEDLTTLSSRHLETGRPPEEGGVLGEPAQPSEPELCAALLERSWNLRTENPQEMKRLALLAAGMAAGLDPERHGARVVANLRRRAAIDLANAYRITDFLPEAERWLAEADRLLSQEPADDLLKARFLSIRASYLSDLRRFPEAFEALDAAYAIYKENGDDHLAGRVLIGKGKHAQEARDVDAAISLLRQGLSMIDADRDPWLVLVSLHNLAWCMVDDKRYVEARELLRENVWRYERHGGAVDRLRLRWAFGEISAGLDDLDQAVPELSAAREGFITAGLPYSAAIVALDLGHVYLRLGRTREAREVVREAAEVFHTLKIDREALGALLFLEKTFELEVAQTGMLLRSLADFLRRAEDDPEAKFVLPPIQL